MADVLTGAGHSPRVVHAGEKVMAACREVQPRLVLLDVRLGAVSGIDLLKSIKAEWPEIEAIVLTAYGSVETAVQAMKLGAAEFLTKPVDLDVLTTTVEKVLAASDARLDDSGSSRLPSRHDFDTRAIAGDVALSYQFTHMADASARIVLQNALFPGPEEEVE